MRRLILFILLTTMFFPALLFAQELNPDAPQRPLARAANTARVRDIDMRARELEEQARNLEMREREMDERTENLVTREREIEERAGNLEMRENELREHAENLEMREREMESDEKEKEMQPLILLILVVNILCAVWVYQDIQKRSHESGIWIVIALIAGLLGTLVYAIIRLGDNTKSKA